MKYITEVHNKSVSDDISIYIFGYSEKLPHSIVHSFTLTSFLLLWIIDGFTCQWPGNPTLISCHICLPHFGGFATLDEMVGSIDVFTSRKLGVLNPTWIRPENFKLVKDHRHSSQDCRRYALNFKFKNKTNNIYYKYINTCIGCSWLHICSITEIFVPSSREDFSVI